TEDDVRTIVGRALDDPERGLAGSLGPEGGVSLADEPFDHLVSISGGDARQALNVLENAVALAESEGARDANGRVAPTLADVEAAAQERVLAYDRAGDGHYDTVSAFIKSIRGNDPDAALYWLATMVAAGEDPRFIARRLIISASEDVGNADPRGLQVAVAAAQALDHVGLPEAQYALAQATTYLATAPKSNRSGQAYWAAVGDVNGRGSLPVPNHLRGAPYPQMKHYGFGVGYRFPHDYEGADVDQQYLPDELADRRYYRPSEQGYEATIASRMETRRETRTTGAKKRASSDRGPEVAGMREADRIMRTREANRAKLAETERKDAAGE
ncbi:MAG TPA: hypothetical protein VGK63_04895, partial [Candidatus Limnocylindrales bacterium]